MAGRSAMSLTASVGTLLVNDYFNVAKQNERNKNRARRTGNKCFGPQHEHARVDFISMGMPVLWKVAKSHQHSKRFLH